MYEFLANAVRIMLLIVVIKALTVGSQFDFYYNFKYGKNYRRYYFNRPKFDPNKIYMRDEK